MHCPTESCGGGRGGGRGVSISRARHAGAAIHPCRLSLSRASALESALPGFDYRFTVKLLSTFHQIRLATTGGGVGGGVIPFVPGGIGVLVLL